MEALYGERHGRDLTHHMLASAGYEEAVLLCLNIDKGCRPAWVVVLLLFFLDLLLL